MGGRSAGTKKRGNCKSKLGMGELRKKIEESVMRKGRVITSGSERGGEC